MEDVETVGRDITDNGTGASLRSVATGASSASMGLDVDELAALKDFEEDLELALPLPLGVPTSSCRISCGLSKIFLTGVLPLTMGLLVLGRSLGKDVVGGGGSTLESVYSRSELS